MLQLIEDDVTIELRGTFDWTEAFASISWGLGSDGEAFTEGFNRLGLGHVFGYGFVRRLDRFRLRLRPAATTPARLFLFFLFGFGLRLDRVDVG